MEILQFECQRRIQGSCKVLQGIKNWISTYETGRQREEAQGSGFTGGGSTSDDLRHQRELER
jgi:hypothetical protein